MGLSGSEGVECRLGNGRGAPGEAIMAAISHSGKFRHAQQKDGWKLERRGWASRFRLTHAVLCFAVLQSIFSPAYAADTNILVLPARQLNYSEQIAEARAANKLRYDMDAVKKQVANLLLPTSSERKSVGLKGGKQKIYFAILADAADRLKRLSGEYTQLVLDGQALPSTDSLAAYIRVQVLAVGSVARRVNMLPDVEFVKSKDDANIVVSVDLREHVGKPDADLKLAYNLDCDARLLTKNVAGCDLLVVPFGAIRIPRYSDGSTDVEPKVAVLEFPIRSYWQSIVGRILLDDPLLAVAEGFYSNRDAIIQSFQRSKDSNVPLLEDIGTATAFNEFRVPGDTLLSFASRKVRGYTQELSLGGPGVCPDCRIDFGSAQHAQIIEARLMRIFTVMLFNIRAGCSIIQSGTDANHTATTRLKQVLEESSILDFEQSLSAQVKDALASILFGSELLHRTLAAERRYSDIDKDNFARLLIDSKQDLLMEKIDQVSTRHARYDGPEGQVQFIWKSTKN